MEELAAYLDVWSVVTRTHPALRTFRVFLSFRELLCLSHANPINAQGRVQRPKIESNMGHSDNAQQDLPKFCQFCIEFWLLLLRCTSSPSFHRCWYLINILHKTSFQTGSKEPNLCYTRTTTHSFFRYLEVVLSLLTYAIPQDMYCFSSFYYNGWGRWKIILTTVTLTVQWKNSLSFLSTVNCVHSNYIFVIWGKEHQEQWCVGAGSCWLTRTNHTHLFPKPCTHVETLKSVMVGGFMETNNCYKELELFFSSESWFVNITQHVNDQRYMWNQ